MVSLRAIGVKVILGGDAMAEDASRRSNWARLPLIATVARVLCREVTLENEYLRVQCEVVRSKVPGRIRFTDQERNTAPLCTTACRRTRSAGSRSRAVARSASTSRQRSGCGTCRAVVSRLRRRPPYLRSDSRLGEVDSRRDVG